MSVCDLPVVHSVCHAATNTASSWLSGALDSAAPIAGGAASYLFEAMWKVFDATTVVDLTSTRFTRVYDLLFGIAIFLMLLFFALQVISGMLRRDPAALSRAALGLAKSVLGSFVILTLVTAALAITDQLVVGIVAATGTTMGGLGARIATLFAAVAVTSTLQPGVGALIALFVASLAIGGVFIIWMSLLVRKALLLVAIVFAPIALAGASWDATRGWISRWATFVIALSVSKLVMVVFFLLAATQASAPIDGDLQSLSDPISGIVLLLVAAFAPYLTYKAISFVGVDFHHAMTTEQEAKSALNRPLPTSTRIPGTRAPAVLDFPTTHPAPSAAPTPSAGVSPTGAPGGATAAPPAAAVRAGSSSATGACGATSGGGAAAGASAASGAAAGAVPAVAGLAAAGGAWSGGQGTGRLVAGAADTEQDAATGEHS